MQDRCIIVALVGESGAGKTTAAQHLVERFGFRRLSLAEPIKQIAKRVLGFMDEQLYSAGKDEIDARYNVTPRAIYQRLGNAGREVLVGAANGSTVNVEQGN